MFDIVQSWSLTVAGPHYIDAEYAAELRRTQPGMFEWKGEQWAEEFFGLVQIP